MIKITLLHFDPSAQRPDMEFHKALFLDHVLYKTIKLQSTTTFLTMLLLISPAFDFQIPCLIY